MLIFRLAVATNPSRTSMRFNLVYSYIQWGEGCQSKPALVFVVGSRHRDRGSINLACTAGGGGIWASKVVYAIARSVGDEPQPAKLEVVVGGNGVVVGIRPEDVIELHVTAKLRALLGRARALAEHGRQGELAASIGDARVRRDCLPVSDRRRRHDAQQQS
jgi:hypothetical protein